mgnify:CR=1 FL=1
MEFIETPTFTRLLASLLTDDEYRALQNVLVENPARGDLIPGGGGIRKLRHALPKYIEDTHFSCLNNERRLNLFTVTCLH